jgi:hypothetical protein
MRAPGGKADPMMRELHSLAAMVLAGRFCLRTSSN